MYHCYIKRNNLGNFAAVRVACNMGFPNRSKYEINGYNKEIKCGKMRKMIIKQWLLGTWLTFSDSL